MQVRTKGVGGTSIAAVRVAEAVAEVVQGTSRKKDGGSGVGSSKQQ